jgi:putative transcriptional regulator
MGQTTAGPDRVAVKGAVKRVVAAKVAVKKRSPARTNVADELIASLREGVEIMAGRQAPSRFYPAPIKIDVRAIRQHIGLSQPDFAKRFGFTTSAVREWEQGRRQPEAAARVLLLVIASRPEVVDEVLAAAMPQAA